MEEGVIITADPGMERVHLFDRDDGRLIRRMEFDQPTVEERRLALLRTGGVLCGPKSEGGTEGIAAVSLTTGEDAWSMALPQSVGGFFVPKEGYIGLGLLGGAVRIVEAATGEVVSEHSIPTVHFVMDGVLFERTLLVRYLASPNRAAYQALDILAGQVLWSNANVAPLERWSQPVEVFAGAVAVMTTVDAPPDPRMQAQGPLLAVSFLATKSGAPLGPPIPMAPVHVPMAVTGEFGVWPGAVIVGTYEGIRGLRTEPREEAEAGAGAGTYGTNAVEPVEPQKPPEHDGS
jgi:hypothetical protein